MITIFYFDQDTLNTKIIHTDNSIRHQDDVWAEVFKAEELFTTFGVETVDEVMNELGDDICDYLINAVIPGKHDCIYGQLLTD